MNIIFISPIGKETPNLFQTMTKTFSENGHIITTNPEYAEVVFCDLFSGLGEFDAALLNILVSRKLPFIFFDESDYGGCKDGTDEWFGFNRLDDKGYCNNMFGFITLNCPVVYFMRKMDKTIDYPSWVYPYELCMYPDHILPITTADELFNRPNDIFFVGNSSPTRRNVIKELNATDLKLDIALVEQRITHEHWLDMARQSKMFLECCGGGFGSERPYQLMYISPMLRVKNNQLILHNFRDGLECIEISEFPTTQEIQNLKEILTDKDRLFEMYQRGIDRMQKYFNYKYRANYILKILKQEGVC